MALLVVPDPGLGISRSWTFGAPDDCTIGALACGRSCIRGGAALSFMTSWYMAIILLWAM